MFEGLTPYDTGEVLQPHVWDMSDPDSDYGHGFVDFDDDEGITQAMVQTHRLADGYLMVVEDFVNGETHLIHLKRKEE